METKAHHVLIGAFVLLTVIGALFFGLWVAKASLDSEFTEYDIVFNETVTGLTKGAAVNFNGIQVGEVRRLSLDPKNATRVLARVRLGSDTPVKTDTSARLAFTGITGVAIIELIGGGQSASALLPPSEDGVAVIVAEPSVLQKFMTNGADVLVRFNETLTRVTEMLNPENVERVNQIVLHIEAVADQIDQDKAELGSALRRADQAFADLSATSKSFEKVASRADRMLDQELQPAMADLRQTLNSVREITGRVDGLVQRNSSKVDQLAQQGIPGFTAAVDELRILAVSLNRISGRLQAAPADYLLQRDRPREYQPK